MSKEQRSAGASSATTSNPSTTGRAPGHSSRTAGLAPSAAAASSSTAGDGPDPTAGLLQPFTLPGALRERFEDSLGVDLGGVRLHTDEASAADAAAMGARAFAHGSDIHFAAGQYRPDDPFGQHLIAHEVAHTQQATSTPMAKLAIANTTDVAEIEADAAADAMVAGAPATLNASRSAAIHRSPEEKPPKIGEAKVPEHALSGEEKSDLEWARTVTRRASKTFDHALGALELYADKADTTLTTIETTFQAITTMTSKAHKKVNDTIAKYKELDKLQAEVMGKVLGAVITGAGGVTGIAEKVGAVGKLEAINNNVQYSLKSVAKGRRAMQALKLGGDSAVPGGNMAGLVDAGKEAVDTGKDLAGKASEGGGGGGGLTEPWVQELAFWKSFSGMHGESTKLIKAAVGLAGLGKPIGTLERAIADVAKANKTDPGYPIARMKKDAQALFDATSELDGGVEHIPELLTDMKAVLTQLVGAKPKDQKALEKEMWIQWMAGMDGSDKEQLATSGLREYLRKEGIWEQLGIDPGTWFSDDEQSTVVCMANAQAKVLAHKGETISPTNKVVTTVLGNVEMLAVKLGSLPELPAKVTEGEATPMYAQVIGVKATHEIDPEVLEGVKGKEAITERILRKKYVTVLLKGMKDANQ